MKCKVCGKGLLESQARYCSLECRKLYNRNSYQAQRRRGVLRKALLVSMFGGCCSNPDCGYKKGLAGLCFHHRDPPLKKFMLDSRNLSNRSWKSCLEEAEKCVLLCATCHHELHAKGCYDGIEFGPHIAKNPPPEYLASTRSRSYKKRQQKHCPDCSSLIGLSATKCMLCAHKDLERISWPPTEELRARVSTASFCQVARELGVSDNAIRRRLKTH